MKINYTLAFDYEHGLGDTVWDLTSDMDEDSVDPVGVVTGRFTGGGVIGMAYEVHFPDAEGSDSDVRVLFTWDQLVPVDIKRRVKWERAKKAHEVAAVPFINPHPYVPIPYTPPQPIINPQPYIPRITEYPQWYVGDNTGQINFPPDNGLTTTIVSDSSIKTIADATGDTLVMATDEVAMAAFMTDMMI